MTRNYRVVNCREKYSVNQPPNDSLQKPVHRFKRTTQDLIISSFAISDYTVEKYKMEKVKQSKYASETKHLCDSACQETAVVPPLAF